MEKRKWRPLLLIIVIIVLLRFWVFNDPFAYILDENLEGPPNRSYSISYKEMYTLISVAKTIPYRPVMISVLNDAFLPFALSWFCNTKHMEFQKQVLLITTDTITKQQLNKQWPEVKVLVFSVDKSLQGAQNYSHAGYVRLVIFRTQILKALLDNDIEVFLFEFDSLWLRNPLPLLHSFSGKYDILFGGVSTRPGTINGGLMYLFPSYSTKQVFMMLDVMLWELNKKMLKLQTGQFIPIEHNDQEYMSILAERHYAGLRYKVLPLSEFADGKWYSLSREKQLKTSPILICSNWIVGNQNKILRAKKWGHWFIKDNNSCDTIQVKSVIRKFTKQI